MLTKTQTSTFVSPFLSLLPPGAATAETRELNNWPLYPGEEQYVRNALSSRRAEFSTGRKCARDALIQLGHDPVAILAVNRCPVFPPAVCGSITHTTKYCAAAVVARGEILSIGIDAEPAVPLSVNLLDLILTPSELKSVRSRPDSPILPTIYFSIKESFYKAHYMLYGVFMEFRDVQVTILNGREFKVQIVAASNACKYRFHGAYAVDHELVYSVAAFYPR